MDRSSGLLCCNIGIAEELFTDKKFNTEAIANMFFGSIIYIIF